MTVDDQTRIAALPGVRRAEFLREQQLLLDPAKPRVVLLARTIDEGIEALRRNPEADSAVSVSVYNMWSPLRARRLAATGYLEPFVPFEAFGDPATLNCDRDSQGDLPGHRRFPTR